MSLIDLRSDTVTKPTVAMLEAMMRAEVGDDVYEDDPTVKTLEKRTAELLGFKAALFVPSGTMANQIAIHLHTRPGDSVLIEQDSHVYLYEAGAASALSGVQFDSIPWSEEFAPDSITSRCREDGLHSSPTTLLVVENTHNRQAGRVLHPEHLQKIVHAARQQHLKVHCDGARIWNAAVALGCDERALLRGFDSVSVCFSKGLGAPVGSVLCGDSEWIQRARKVRKRWGGAMRQVGYLAAAGLYALDHHRARLADDHRHAALMAERLQSVSDVEIRYPAPGTNMLYCRSTRHDAKVISSRLRSEGILANALSNEWLRLVTHLDVDQKQVLKAADVLCEILRMK